MTVRTIRSRRALPAVVLAGAALASLAACSSDDGGDSGGDGGSSSGEFSVANALADLPRSALEDNYVLTVADLDRATELAGATRPASASGDLDEIFDWANDLQGILRPDGGGWPAVAVLFPEATNPTRLADIAEFGDELGWTVLDVGSFAEVSAPPARFTVLHGEFDVEQIDAAIDSNDDDVWSIGEEDFAQDLAQRSAARPLGESLRLAEQDGALAVSKSTPPLDAWLDGRNRLDGNDDLAAVAEALDQHDVYSAMILDGETLVFVPPVGQDTNAEELEAMLGEQLLPFEALGAGLTVVEDEAVGVLAYSHSTGDAAEENAELLEAMFADGASVITREPLSSLFEDVEVAVHGSTVTVTVGFTDDTSPINLWRTIQARELFASHR